jgi:hypothetical protein
MLARQASRLTSAAEIEGSGIEEHRVSDQERIGTGSPAAHLNCPVCGHLYRAGDRFCAECGAVLPTETVTVTEQTSQSPHDQTADAWAVSPPAPAMPPTTLPAPGASPASDPAPESEGSFWILGATPTTVIGGGLLLLILAAILLFVGQLDNTGTVVMLSICVAPIALLVLLVGIVRTVAGAARRG